MRGDQIMKKRTLIAYIWLVFCSSIVVGLASSEYAGGGDAFKIKYANQEIQVRTSRDEYVTSTWEQAILNQGLAEQSAKVGCKIDVAGMCCSHAVINALEYCHTRCDLLASYLHKAVTGGYDQSMSLEEAMYFVKNNGVMALPPKQTIKHGSGLPWPTGKKYKFTEVINVDNCLPLGPSPDTDKASIYKAILVTNNHPIVVSILSGYKGYKDKSPFLKYRGTDPEDSSKMEVQDDTMPDDAQPVYHAIILYGFRESTGRFFVKNSWGPEFNNGLCTLPFEYINRFAISAFVGLGYEDKQGGKVQTSDQAPITTNLIQLVAHDLPRDDEMRRKIPDLLNLLQGLPLAL